MLTQNMSYVADHSGRSNAMYGSYKPAVQVGMQPPTACHLGATLLNGRLHPTPTACHLGEGMPTLLNGRLHPTLKALKGVGCKRPFSRVGIPSPKWQAVAF